MDVNKRKGFNLQKAVWEKHHILYITNKAMVNETYLSKKDQQNGKKNVILEMWNEKV